MPKKVHGRPAKGKARTRRPQARPTDISTSARPVEPSAPPTATATAAAPAAASPASSASARRTTLRRAPSITINYHYLRHDLTQLAILAPTMVVLLVVSYFVFHTG